ncbi:MAG TPA: hypothetical protein VMU66_10735, partial [Gaiellales bacterium]|nr:hypothetical protein [Gaiellales bacterium]
ADWVDAIRRGDLEVIGRRLDDGVVHVGVDPDWICRGRDEVLGNLGRRAGGPPAVEAIELVAAGDHLVMSVRGPRIGAPVDKSGARRGVATIVFTLRQGVIVHIQDYLHRSDALAAVGAAGSWE